MADIKYELWVEKTSGDQELFGAYDDEHDFIRAEDEVRDHSDVVRCFRVRILTCPYCGNEFGIGRDLTYKCDECGALFNFRGDTLRDPSEWEENDEEDC